MTTRPPAPWQFGPAGDITAARKVRVFDVPIEEAMAMYRRGETPPEHMANSLYLEWFSERSGRVAPSVRPRSPPVHRHTLRYRMRELEELSGRDLSNSFDRMELWLALRARDLLAVGADG